MSMADSAERRRLRRLRGTLAAALLTVSVGLGVLAAGPAQPAGATTKPTITGTGSSYAALAINQWVAEVYSYYGDTINYSTQSSVIGLNEFATYPQVDFGASEIGYSTGQADQEPTQTWKGKGPFKYQYLPDIAGATCLDYNLQTSFGQQITGLKLDSAVMAGIFSGTITYWDDSQLKALNPGVDLPHSPIIVVYRSDASGDNFIFSDYLYDTQQSTWNTFTGTLHQPSGAQAIWPLPTTGGSSVGKYTFKNWTSANGSNLASDYVAQNQGSITYVETGYALLHNDPCAAVDNASGAYVKPSEAADAIALQNDTLQPDLEQTLTPVFMSSQARAYPISAYSYLVMAEQTKTEISSSKQPVEAQFVQFLACQGQESAGELGYSPLPVNLVEADFAAAERIDGVQLPAPTASNCPDPYVTGAFNAAPPPKVSSTTTANTSPGASTSPIANSGNSGNSGTSHNSGSNGSSGNSGSSGHSGSGSSGSSQSSSSSGNSGSGQTSTTGPQQAQSPTSASAGGGGSPASTRRANGLTSVEPPAGQTWSRSDIAMGAAVNLLLRLPVSVLVVVAAAGFLLVLLVPPLIFFEAQRRRRTARYGPRAGRDGP
jgi:phosphate ABC transporter phosphate-binding protein